MLDYTDKESLKQFLEDNDIQDPVQLDMLYMLFRQMTGVLLEQMLETERDEHLGYTRDYTRDEGRSKQTNNSRNGYSPRKVRSNQGELDLQIPRDRKGDFEPQAVKKHQRDVSEIADKIISMYARGMISALASLAPRSAGHPVTSSGHLQCHYIIPNHQQLEDNITDSILPRVEGRNRQLESIYAIVYIDGHRYQDRWSQISSQKGWSCAGLYTPFIDLDGQKDLLGLWISGTESAKYCLGVFTELRNRGVSDMLIATSDDLSGVEYAIKSVYPEVEYQGCVIHVIRLKYVSYQDRKEFSKWLKSIYQASTEEAALASLDKLKEHWGDEYPLAG